MYYSGHLMAVLHHMEYLDFKILCFEKVAFVHGLKGCKNVRSFVVHICVCVCLPSLSLSKLPYVNGTLRMYLFQ